MIDSYLTEMGIAGIWILTMLYDRQVFQKRIEKVINNNTESNNKIREVISHCKEMNR